MTIGVIELNDAGISSYYDGKVQGVEAGCALIDNQALVLGNKAYAQTKLKPGWTNNRYWSQLNLEPLSNATDTIRHHADLAYAQLEQIWAQTSGRCDSVILAVPGTLQKPQLSLLLGIARELKIPVSGLVDAAVVAASEVESQRQLMHLDVQLHRIILTLLDQGPRLQRASVVVIAEAGLNQLQTRWANVVGDAFVRATRFDPMHGAESEQALYDQLPNWLRQITVEDSAHLELEVGGRKHNTTLQRDQLVGATADVYPKIVEHVRGRLGSQGCTLLLSHRFEAFPGLDDTLALLGDCDVVHLKSDASAVGALKHSEHIASTGENVSFVTSIPWQKTEGGTNQTEDLTPTHVVYRGRAKLIDSQGCCIGVDVDQGINVSSLSKGISRKHCTVRRDGSNVRVDDHSSYGTFINELKVADSALLQAGDTIRIGEPGEELLLISVTD